MTIPKKIPKIYTSPLLFIAFFLAYAPFAYAELQLDSIQFDPAIINSGDEVDIVIQFHESGISAHEYRIGNQEYTFRVTLSADDSLSKQYLLVQDSEGDDLHGTIISGDYYLKRFRIKVLQNAPPGNYELKLSGQWYKNGEPEPSIQYERFKMNVKGEGISLSIANVVSEPSKVRSGDKNILLTTDLFNSGEKAAKNVSITLSYPQGITSSYTNNNQLMIGVLEAQQKQTLQFYVDTDKNLLEGMYLINYTLSYQDLDGNSYTSGSSFPFVVKKKPRIVVVNSTGSGLSGEEGKITVVLQNLGEEKSDSVDIRIVKQSSQPFEMDVRSEYLGQMKPQETATAVFSLSTLSEAEIKTHKLNVLIRAKGDSEEGDDNIYTSTDSITFDVVGKKKNPYPLYGLIFAGIVILGAVSYHVFKKKK